MSVNSRSDKSRFDAHNRNLARVGPAGLIRLHSRLQRSCDGVLIGTS
jgi:hypothetical protein